MNTLHNPQRQPIVTVAAEHGAGGDLVAPRVADALGVPFLDRVLPPSLAVATGESSRPSGLVGGLARASTLLAGEPVERMDLDEGHVRADFAEFLARTSSDGGVVLGRGGVVVVADAPGAHGLIQDLEDGYVRRVAFVVPGDVSWPMPLYALALMTAERAYDCSAHCELMLLTAEDAPLALFGREASRALEVRLVDAGVGLLTGVHVEVLEPRLLELHPGGDRLQVDRVVTLPRLEGPSVPGLPADAAGFIPVDRHGRVPGLRDVYAAGDATQFPIKQGGLACQQADAVAEAIAARVGAAVVPRPYKAMLQGVLLTEREATFLQRDAGGTGGDESALSATPLWWPPSKIAGSYARGGGGLTSHVHVAGGSLAGNDHSPISSTVG